jgi:hypothetical protein
VQDLSGFDHQNPEASTSGDPYGEGEGGEGGRKKKKKSRRKPLPDEIPEV